MSETEIIFEVSGDEVDGGYTATASRIWQRLEALKSMEDGWLDGGGIAPSRQGLDWLSQKLLQFLAQVAVQPRLYPTPEGGIEAEWSFPAASVILEFDLESRRGEWLQFAKTDHNDEVTHVCDLNSDVDWEWIARELRRLATGA